MTPKPTTEALSSERIAALYEDCQRRAHARYTSSETNEHIETTLALLAERQETREMLDTFRRDLRASYYAGLSELADRVAAFLEKHR